MRLATWNVNSLNARQEHFANWLDRTQPDVVALQELKLTEDRIPGLILRSRGYEYAAQGQPTYNGVLIASKQPIRVIQKGLPDADEGQARVLMVETAGVQVLDLYCPQGSEVTSPKFAYKLRFYDALLAWLAPQVRPDARLVVTGDLNIAPEPDDVWSVEEMKDQVSYHPLEHERFAALLALGLSDVVKPRLAPRSFTFWDYRELSFRRKRGMRIDHVLTTPDLAATVTGAGVDIEERKREKASDHAPVWVELG